MPVVNGDDPNSWLFRANRYFQLYKVTDYKKLTVVVVSLEGEVLNWYRELEDCKPFKDWKDFKIRLLERFQSA